MCLCVWAAACVFPSFSHLQSQLPHQRRRLVVWPTRWHRATSCPVQEGGEFRAPPRLYAGRALTIEQESNTSSPSSMQPHLPLFYLLLSSHPSVSLKSLVYIRFLLRFCLLVCILWKFVDMKPSCFCLLLGFVSGSKQPTRQWVNFILSVLNSPLSDSQECSVGFKAREADIQAFITVFYRSCELNKSLGAALGFWWTGRSGNKSDESPVCLGYCDYYCFIILFFWYKKISQISN